MPILHAQDLEGFIIEQTATVLEEMERGWRLLYASNDGKRPARDYAEPIEQVLRRIAYERTSGGLIPTEQFTNADIDALKDLSAA